MAAGACRDSGAGHGGHFVAGARETSCLGGPEWTFRDRRKGSERLYLEVQSSWQAQLFGHNGVLRRASDSVTGAVNRDFSTCGPFSEVGGSLARKLRFGILMLSLEALAVKRLGRAAARES